MFYRIKVDLAFPGETEARRAIQKAIAQLPNSIIINPGQPNEERGSILIEQCYHDDNPVLPCLLLDLWTTPNPP